MRYNLVNKVRNLNDIKNLFTTICSCKQQEKNVCKVQYCTHCVGFNFKPFALAVPIVCIA